MELRIGVKTLTTLFFLSLYICVYILNIVLGEGVNLEKEKWNNKIGDFWGFQSMTWFCEKN